MKKNQTGGHIVQSVDRALSIIELFNDRTQELTLNEISAAIDLSPSTTYGLVNTLFHRHFLSKNNLNGKYTLGKAMLTPKLELQHKINNLLIREANWYMHKLSAEFNITVMLFSHKNTILTNLKNVTPTPVEFTPIVDYHTSVSARNIMTRWTEKEIREYFSQRSMVRYTEKTITDVDILLEKIHETKERGYAIQIDELDIGWGAYGVMIFGINNEIIGTLSIDGPKEVLISKQKEICGKMLIASEKISQKAIQELSNDAMNQ